MRYSPDFETFCRCAAGNTLVPVARRLISDALTPVSAFHRLNAGPHACLFESVIGGEKVGRYSFLATQPFCEVAATGQLVSIRRFRRDGSCSGEEQRTVPDPLAELQAELGRWRAARVSGLPPFCGGAIGYAGYDTVRYVERLPHAPPDDRGLPDLCFALYDHMLVFDNVQKTLSAIALARMDGRGDEPTRADLARAYDEACARCDDLIAQLSRPSEELPIADIDTSGDPQLDVQANCTSEQFQAAVRQAQEYIRAGDIFQVVLSQRWQTQISVPPFEIYRTLRVVNPSPFMFYLRTPATTLVGSSPEILVRVLDGRVTVRPLAGTRRRGATEADDRRLAEELLADPKERAEHVMLVDLGRNDVGRVSRYGSVQLSDVMVIERYSHVMHITSNVTGELAEGLDAFAALRSCLPAGTVSGAPKVRAMQIIDELEPCRRGPYAGAVGYIDFSGNMDTCIALRTIVVQGDQAYVQAGAGIVADSDPSSEYQETLNKARGLFKAIEITEQRRA